MADIEYISLTESAEDHIIKCGKSLDWLKNLPLEDLRKIDLLNTDMEILTAYDVFENLSSGFAQLAIAVRDYSAEQFKKSLITAGQ